MARNRISLLRTSLIVADLAVLVVAFVIASRVRMGRAWWAVWSQQVPDIGVIAPAVALLIIGLFWLAGLYRLRRRWALADELRDLGRTALGVAAGGLAGLYIFKAPQVSRLLIFTIFGVAATGLILNRVGVHLAFCRARAHRRGLRHLLVVDEGGRAARFVNRIEERPELGASVIGYLSNSGKSLPPYARLGGLDDLPRVLANHIVDEVVICLPFQQEGIINRLVQLCDEQGKVARLPVDISERAVRQGRLEVIEGVPTLAVSRAPDRVLALAVKRGIDIIGASIVLLLAGPALAMAAAVIYVQCGRPIIFRQSRTGLHGRRFAAIKLRTMVPDAEIRLPDLLAQNERTGPVFKMTADPRVTRIGRLLRRTSIDELPQLWNVLRGDMSLVGPRPALLSEVEVYDPWQRRRLSVKPGLTGLWQISARDNPDFNHWVQLDLEYIDQWSLMGDVKLLLKTPGALVRSPGQ